MSDDGFHEIQLNGKQLIFLCMAAALILVVAFLSGVLVGRGVSARVDNAAAIEAAASTPTGLPEGVEGDAQPQSAAAEPAPPITAVAPATPIEEDLSYSRRLQAPKPPSETVGRADAGAAPARPTTGAGATKPSLPPSPAAAQVAAADPAKAKMESAASAEPPGPGYYLKVVAYRDRGQADGIAKRLSGKGYHAYVVPLSGRGLYSVRVGKYKTRREADTTRRRLEKEEQLKSLISH